MYELNFGDDRRWNVLRPDKTVVFSFGQFDHVEALSTLDKLNAQSLDERGELEHFVREQVEGGAERLDLWAEQHPFSQPSLVDLLDIFEGQLPFDDRGLIDRAEIAAGRLTHQEIEEREAMLRECGARVA